MGRSLLALALLAAALVPNAAAKSWYYPLVFDKAVATPGEAISIRTAYTPRRYIAPPTPGGPAIDVFLVPAEIAGTVTRGDRRLLFVGRIQADVGYHGVVRFKLPDVAAGDYATALGNPVEFISTPADYGNGDAFGVTRGPRVLTVLPKENGVDAPLIGLGIVLGAAAGLFGIRHRRLR
jgi:hypothetical protein